MNNNFYVKFSVVTCDGSVVYTDLVNMYTTILEWMETDDPQDIEYYCRSGLFMATDEDSVASYYYEGFKKTVFYPLALSGVDQDDRSKVNIIVQWVSEWDETFYKSNSLICHTTH